MPIALDSGYYIERPYLQSNCYDAIKQPGIIINICAPKQMGKTSMMIRILAYAETRNYHTVSLNLQLPENETLNNLKNLLKWFCARVSKDNGLLNQVAEFWDDSLDSKTNATDYLETIILPQCSTKSSQENAPLIIAIDEINELFAYPHIAREFFLLLRTWSEKAKLKLKNGNLWQKLRLIIIYSTEVLLPPSLPPSIFNTMLKIKLPLFNLEEVQDLANKYQYEINLQQIKQLINLLGGHPYRLQLAFCALKKEILTLEELFKNKEIAIHLYKEHLQQQWWNLQPYPELIDIFTQIVRTPNPLQIKVSLGNQLEKMGLIYLKGDRARISCDLFRLFFGEILL